MAWRIYRFNNLSRSSRQLGASEIRDKIKSIAHELSSVEFFVGGNFPTVRMMMSAVLVPKIFGTVLPTSRNVLNKTISQWVVTACPYISVLSYRESSTFYRANLDFIIFGNFIHDFYLLWTDSNRHNTQILSKRHPSAPFCYRDGEMNSVKGDSKLGWRRTRACKTNKNLGMESTYLDTNIKFIWVSLADKHLLPENVVPNVRWSRVKNDFEKGIRKFPTIYNHIE